MNISDRTYATDKTPNPNQVPQHKSFFCVTWKFRENSYTCQNLKTSPRDKGNAEASKNSQLTWGQLQMRPSKHEVSEGDIIQEDWVSYSTERRSGAIF